MRLFSSKEHQTGPVTFLDQFSHRTFDHSFTPDIQYIQYIALIHRVICHVNNKSFCVFLIKLVRELVAVYRVTQYSP